MTLLEWARGQKKNMAANWADILYFSLYKMLAVGFATIFLCAVSFVV
jgi:hypothetical protein